MLTKTTPASRRLQFRSLNGLRRPAACHPRMLAVFVAAMALGEAAQAETCTNIGGTEVGGDCTLSVEFVCSGDTHLGIPGDLTITGTGAINCGSNDLDIGGAPVRACLSFAWSRFYWLRFIFLCSPPPPTENITARARNKISIHVSAVKIEDALPRTEHYQTEVFGPLVVGALISHSKIQRVCVRQPLDPNLCDAGNPKRPIRA